MLTRKDILTIPKLHKRMTNQEIADELGTSIHNVKKHLSVLRKKGFDIPNRPSGRPVSY